MFLAVPKGKLEAPSVPTSVTKDNIPWVYHARGLALMLIVYRHIVLGMKFSGIEISDFMYDFQNFFYNFRMPAFFILSGVFLAKSLSRKSNAAVAKNKA